MATTSDVRGEVKGTLKLTKRTASVLSASTYSSALAMPAVAQEAPETSVTDGLLGIATGGRGRLELTFCGVGADGKDYPYHVIGWRHGKGGKGQGFIPEKIAAGGVTIGTRTLAAEGAWLDGTADGTASRWADTISDTSASGYAIVYSPVDNTMARLSIDVSSFIYVTVRVTKTGATAAPTSMTVVANLADLVGDTASRVNAGRTYFDAVVDVAAGATDAELLGAQGANKEIWLLGYSFHAGVAAGTFLLKSANTEKTGTKPVGVNGGSNRDAPQDDCPILKCAANEALNMTTVGCSIDGEINGFVVDV